MKNGEIGMRIESKVMNLAEEKRGVIYLYDDIGPDEYDWWNGEVIVSETSEKFIRDRLSELEGVNMLDIHISSKGGYVQTGINLYAQIKAFSCAKKTAYIDGMAASIATVIAMAADEIVMSGAGLMMIHSPFMTATGSSEELRKAANDLDVIGGAAKAAYLGHAGEKLTNEKISEIMKNETWLTAAQCLEYGLCDRIEEGKKLPENTPAQFLQSMKLENPEMSGNHSDGAKQEVMARLDKIQQNITALMNKLDKPEQGVSAAPIKSPKHEPETPEKEQAAENRAGIIAAMLWELSNLF